MITLDNAINWFEIPVDNFERAKKFYESIFDYQMPEMTMGHSRMGFFLYDFKNQKVGGAIVHNPDFFSPSKNGSLVYLNANPDLSVILSRVEIAGGKVLIQKEPVSEEQNLGYTAIFLDSEGNRVALHSMS